MDTIVGGFVTISLKVLVDLSIFSTIRDHCARFYWKNTRTPADHTIVYRMYSVAE